MVSRRVPNRNVIIHYFKSTRHLKVVLTIFWFRTTAVRVALVGKDVFLVVFEVCWCFLLVSITLYEAEMNTRKVLVVMVFVVIGAILAIYLYDIFSCVFAETSIHILELATFLTLFIGTLIVVLLFRKRIQSFQEKL